MAHLLDDNGRPRTRTSMTKQLLLDEKESLFKDLSAELDKKLSDERKSLATELSRTEKISELLEALLTESVKNNFVSDISAEVTKNIKATLDVTIKSVVDSHFKKIELKISIIDQKVESNRHDLSILRKELMDEVTLLRAVAAVHDE